MSMPTQKLFIQPISRQKSQSRAIGKDGIEIGVRGNRPENDKRRDRDKHHAFQGRDQDTRQHLTRTRSVTAGEGARRCWVHGEVIASGNAARPAVRCIAWLDGRRG